MSLVEMGGRVDEPVVETIALYRLIAIVVLATLSQDRGRSHFHLKNIAIECEDGSARNYHFTTGIVRHYYCTIQELLLNG